MAKMDQKDAHANTFIRRLSLGENAHKKNTCTKGIRGTVYGGNDITMLISSRKNLKKPPIGRWPMDNAATIKMERKVCVTYGFSLNQ